ncbi:hypothetical protein niasHT_007186 [Heterodera trifolii]|uniref:Chromo domain-containing protein n=1 Tax=Heterodera trifolii TaxID=157864 RepID=A0ABD2LLA9_9BILA
MDLFSNNNNNNAKKAISVFPEENVNEDVINKSSGSSSNSSDGVPTEEDVFEVEKIIAHKICEGKDYWKVRWVGYGPSDDTWEPRENFLDRKVLKMLKDFETEQHAKKEKRKEISRKSIEYTRSKQEEEDQEDATDEKNESWFGIKPDEGTLEQRRLFVPDRRLSKTEKLLTEIGSSPGVRILRRHLKEHSVERLISPKIEESSPQKWEIHKPRKRRRNDEIFTSESSAQEVFEPNEKGAVAIPERPKGISQKTPNDKRIKEEVESHELKMVFHKRPRIGEEETHNSELGISKSLKPKKLAKLGQKLKLKAASKREDIHTKKTKEEKNAPKKHEFSKESVPHKTKDKQLSKLAVVRLEETGLVVPFACDGINIAAAFERLAVERQTSLSLIDNPFLISQEEFEEMVMDGKVEKVQQLLYGQAANNFSLNRVDEFGKTLLHKLCEIKCGVSHTQCELIHLLVTCGGRLNIIENGNSQIPLHIAIANRRLCHVRQLLNLHSPVNLVDKSGKSPLILALDCSDSEFTKCLLRAGASFQLALEKLYDDKDRNKRQFRIITDHEAQLRKALNAARDAVSMDLSIKCISPIFVNPVHESESVHCFHLKSQPQLPVGDFAYLLLSCVAEFTRDDHEKDFDHSIEARMWGQNPIQSVMMNGKVCQQLKQGNKFAFLCSPCQGENQIKLNLDVVVRKSRNILLTQVVLAQFFRQTRPAGHSAVSSFNCR